MLEEFLLIVLSLITIYLFIKNMEWKFKFEEKVKRYIQEMEEKIRKDAIERSSKVILGKVAERFSPILQKFNYNPRDVRWIGDPIDFIVFDGLYENDLKKIVFVEVKTGKSSLNKHEKNLKEVIREKRVSFEEIKI